MPATHSIRGVARRGADDQAGQSLTEFALVLPLFVFLLMAAIEFGMLYNSILSIQFAARQGVSVAAQAGGVDTADCSILNAIERSLLPPIEHSHIEFVEIFRSDSAGDPVPGVVNRYERTGTLTCGATTQPYSLIGGEGYVQVERKDTLADGLDVVGVRLGYGYDGITPLGFGYTWDLSDGATLRMEPKQ
jgi:hypothetical protein